METDQIEEVPVKTTVAPKSNKTRLAIWLGAILTINALVLSAAIAPSFWSGLVLQVQGKAETLKCTAKAVATLPADVVNTVESANQSLQIPGGPDWTRKVLASRPMDRKGGVAQAEAGFDSDLYG